MAATLQRRKEPLDRLKESEASPGSQGYAGAHPDDVQRSRMNPATIAAKVTENMQIYLAMVVNTRHMLL